MKKMSAYSLGILFALMLGVPAHASDVRDNPAIGRDYSLSTGVGSSGPGMSGYIHSGIQDRPVGASYMNSGRSGRRKHLKEFSPVPIYNNNVELALPHIR